MQFKVSSAPNKSCAKPTQISVINVGCERTYEIVSARETGSRYDNARLVATVKQSIVKVRTNIATMKRGPRRRGNRRQNSVYKMGDEAGLLLDKCVFREMYLQPPFRTGAEGRMPRSGHTGTRDMHMGTGLAAIEDQKSCKTSPPP